MDFFYFFQKSVPKILRAYLYFVFLLYIMCNFVPDNQKRTPALWCDMHYFLRAKMYFA